MEKITILKREQVERLRMYNSVLVTDLYILQGGISVDEQGGYWIKGDYKDKSKKQTYGWSILTWSFSPLHTSCPNTINNGVLPVIPLSEFKNLKKELIENEIEYGEYPQSVVDEELEKQLEDLYQQNKLKKTSKKYKITQIDPNKIDYPYSKNKYMTVDCEEYFYNDNKYIRLKSIQINKDIETFKNGRKTENNKTYFVKVEPIKWIIDKKENIAISKHILASIPFSYNNMNDCYEQSNIKDFLENNFIKEIEPTKILNENIDIEKIYDLVDIMNELSKDEKPKQKVK